jgi:hypothetical protein
MKYVWILVAGLLYPRVAASTLYTIAQWKLGRLAEFPRGHAVVLPWTWTVSEWPDPWTRRMLQSVRLQRWVSFYLSPAHGDCVFDTFVGPLMASETTPPRFPVAVLAEGDCFPLVR